MVSRKPKHSQAFDSRGVELGQSPNLQVTPERIKSLCSEIAREFRPAKIVLFGSYAYGRPHPGSDIDLLVVMPFKGSPFRQASKILGHVVQTIGVTPLDLLVRTREQVQRRIEMGDSFMREIIERGRTMYEADHA